MRNDMKTNKDYCLHCECDTRVMEKRLISKKHKGRFCNMECFNNLEKEVKKRGKDEANV